MATLETAFAEIGKLVEIFRTNESRYLAQDYKENEVRTDFLDKFWSALGWDVYHNEQRNPYEQEVKTEKREHGLSLRRADYAFYLAPNFRDVKFYVEAKKPHGDIATADNYFQAIRYGWNSGNAVAVLHDFEQFEIVDCRHRPDVETALHRAVKKFHYTDYLDKEKFAEIYWLFSREALENDSLEKFAATLPKKRGKAVQRGSSKGGESIDDAFLAELDEYRGALARSFKAKNPDLAGDTLTELTQRTLDRLVFLRFLEDKQIEPQPLIANFGRKGTAWQDFIAASRRLDGIYNGIVYKKHALLDSPDFAVSDAVFSEICEKLCHANSPYDFNVIPIHILGSIYERFLGSVITATAKRATVEQKPEVRKAGGVYYTPEYIVRYIVENTVGKLIEGKSPAQIAEMRFADIACGSGSFLLGVYDLLLSYHTKFYNAHPNKAKKGDTVERDDGLHLSLQKKREILLSNIYGVDIDAQAVEVAQLSLYLKLLADETPASARGYQLEFHETLLPTLNKNIVCGNSLIGTDILSGELFDPLEERKLNPMDFEDRFPQIFQRDYGETVVRETMGFNYEASSSLTGDDVRLKPVKFPTKRAQKKSVSKTDAIWRVWKGGFDAIVGNPPYVRIQALKESSPLSAEYLKTRFKAAAKGNYDIYVAFVERALQLLNASGKLGFILPHKFSTHNMARHCARFWEPAGICPKLFILVPNKFLRARRPTPVFSFSKKNRRRISIFTK